jgi:hypothetical protein
MVEIVCDSSIFEWNGIVPEDKAESKLKWILKSYYISIFNLQSQRLILDEHKRWEIDDKLTGAYLKVTTKLIKHGR